MFGELEMITYVNLISFFTRHTSPIKNPNFLAIIWVLIDSWPLKHMCDSIHGQLNLHYLEETSPYFEDTGHLAHKQNHYFYSWSDS
ncbi:hypothetical protein Hdeb2414_s0017g00502121 [Helianthus debilis subsp. tardiflorus]